ncbi:hypothetical protein K4M64_004539 [Salmonella enterica]|nr:hypothetical protein [Salmonella enterica]
MNQIQQHTTPLDPELSPTAEQMLNSYRDKAAALRNEVPQDVPQSFNPYQAPQQQQDQDESQGRHIGKLEQFVSPIKMGAFNIDTAYTDDKHDNFLENLNDDPAVQEYGEQLHAYLSSLTQAINAGQLSKEDAMKMANDYKNNVIKPIIAKHHSKDSYDKGLHRKREPEIPELIKRIKGVK